MPKFNDHVSRGAATRRVLWQAYNSPSLKRTQRQGVAEKPLYAHGKTWAAWMRENFPAWRYNPASRLWYGPLDDLVKLAAEFPAASKSDGVEDFLAKRSD